MTSQIVRGVAASHSTLMNTHWDVTDDQDGATRYRDALDQARAAVEAATPDLVIVVGSNHFRGLWLDLMPAFTIGVGEVIAAGESGTPKGPLATDPEAAQSIAQHLVDARVDIAFSGKMQVDHGISHAVQYLLPGVDAPVLPLVVNMFAPPLPRLDRCEQVGAELAAAVVALPGDRRVVVVASGGLSHALPWPDWRRPESADDEFMVEAFLDGRENWSDYDTRRREIIVNAPARLNEDFDAEVLSWIESGTMSKLLDHQADLADVAGNGAQELRSWLMVAAACGHAPGRSLGYSAMSEWLTGMGVAVIDDPRPPVNA